MISNSNSNSLVSGTASADTINNYASYVTITAGGGKDKIYNEYVNYVSVNGGSGDDSISNYSAWYSTVDAGTGNDTIIVPFRAWQDSINGGAGNDKISLGTSTDNNNGQNTIVGGTGNDTIYGNANSAYGNVYRYASGDGYDVIKNWTANDTLSFGSVSYRRATVGSDVVFTMQDGGAVTLQGASGKTVNVVGGTLVTDISNSNSNSLVSGTASADTINNYASYVTIVAGGGKDKIYNEYVNYVSVNGGSGDDSISNYSAWYSTVDAGEGNDTIIVPFRAWQDSINGGAGNDKISLGTSTDNNNGQNTIVGGTGNDTIYGNANSAYGNVYRYASGDGYDVIKNWTSNDTLSFGSVSYRRATVGSDVVFSMQDGGAVTLQGASGKTVNVVGGTLVTGISNYNTNSLVSGTANADTINNYAGGVTIRGNGGNDSIYNSTSYYTVKGGFGYVTIDGGEGNDSITSHDPNVSINGGEGNDVITLSSWAKITVKGGTGNDTVYTSSSRTNGILYQYAKGDGYDVITNWTSNDTLSFGSVSYRRATVGSDVVFSMQDGGAVTLQGASGKTVNVVGGTLVTGISNYNTNSLVSGTANADTINNYAGGVTIRGNGGNDSIYNSTSYYTVNGGFGYVTIDGGAGSDTISSHDPNVSINGGEGNDVITLSDWSKTTVKGGTGNDTVYTGSSRSNGILYQYAKGDGYDYITNWTSNDTLSLSGGTYYSKESIGSNVVVSIQGGGAITLQGASGKTVNIYPTVSPTTVINNYNSNSLLSGTDSADTINNYASYVTIVAGGGKDKIYNSYVNYVSVNGGSGDDSISNESAWYSTVDAGEGNDTIIVPFRAWQDSINGGAGNDKISLGTSTDNYNGQNTIVGGTGNDTIYGNANSAYGNVYRYASGDGKDVITNWTSKDTLNLSGATYSMSTVSSNVVVSIQGGGSITLQGGKGKTINIVDGTPVKAINNYNKNSLVSGTANDDTINNYAGGVTIRGNGGNDDIYNSTNSYYTVNGGYGYVTIDGGAGNDTITSYDPNVSIYGGEGNDVINLSDWSKTTVKGGTGNDTVYTGSSRTNGILFQYAKGDGYDYITNWTANDTLSLSGGTYYSKESIGSNVIVSIQGGGAVTLEGASGKTVNIYPTVSPSTVINNYNTNSLVSGTANVDTINNYAGGVTIRGNGGNDYIYNSTSVYHTVKGEYGYVTIDGGDGNDTITSYDPNVSINSGAGNDVINLSTWAKTTVKGGTGNDSIYTSSSRTNGILFQYAKGDGYDYITNWTSNDTLNLGGATYDLSTVSSNVVVSIQGGGAVTLGGGKDKIVKITNGTNIADSPKGTLISNSYSNVSLKGTNYEDTINNSGSNVTITASKGNDTIYNWADKVTVNAGDGKDSLTGGYSNSKLFGEGGNDFISLTGSYWRNTISGGENDDTIYAAGDEHSVDGGAGADRISLSGDKLTVKGGTGNDTIYGSTATSHLYQYAKGDGNDKIFNWSSSDSLTITGGATWTKSTSGNDVIITVKDSGNITLGGAKNKTVNVYPTSAPPPAPTTTVTEQAVIKKFMSSLDKTKDSGVPALNQAVSVASGGYFTNISAVINQLVEDCQRVKNTTTFLRDYCGIDLNNDDTGAISGYDAGSSSVQKTGRSIVPESGSVNDFTATSFTVKGLTVKLGTIPYDGQYVYYPHDLSYGSLSEGQKYIWKAFQTWWAGGALDLIASSYGSNYGFTSSSSATPKTMYFGFFDKAPNKNGGITLAWTAKFSDTLAMSVNFNSKAYGNLLNGGNPDGERSGKSTCYLDRTLAHEMTHAVMMANIDDFKGLPQFITEGMAELTIGSDDDRRSNIEHLASGSYINDLKASLDLYDNKTGTVGDVDAYAGGYMFLRYLAKQSSIHYPASTGSAYSAAASRSISSSSSASGSSSSTVTVKKELLTVSKDFNYDVIDLANYASTVKKINATALVKKVTIFGNKNANSISSGAGNDTISSNSGNDTVRGGAGNDLIYGDAGNDALYGDAGNDSICGGTGNDSLWGGAGKDVFIHKADNDYITDYVPGQDSIKLIDERDVINSSSVVNNDVILKIGTGSVTVKNAKGKKITVIDYTGKSTSKVYGSEAASTTAAGKTLKVTNSTKATVTLDSTYYNADATKRTKAVKITGNTLDNAIFGGTKNDSLYGGKGNDSLIGNDGADKLYGGEGSDTLVGGKGNDSLWGDAGSDTFYYELGDGKDVIFAFSDEDMLTLDNLDFTTSYTKKSGVETITFTVDSGSITLKNFTANTFNVNGDLYKINGKKLALK